jgi:hypothetical protein
MASGKRSEIEMYVAFQPRKGHVRIDWWASRCNAQAGYLSASLQVGLHGSGSTILHAYYGGGRDAKAGVVIAGDVDTPTFSGFQTPPLHGSWTSIDAYEGQTLRLWVYSAGVTWRFTVWERQ